MSNQDFAEDLQEEGFVVQKSKAVLKEERRIAKVAEALEIELLKDIANGKVTLEELDGASLKTLLSGPSIAVVCDDELIYTMPKRALMAVAPPARNALAKDPAMEEVRFNADPAAMLKILRAIEKDLSHPKIPAAWTFEDNIKIYEAARVLGVGDMTKHHRHILCSTISNGLLTYALVEAVCDRIPMKDPVFIHLTHDLAHRRYTQQIPDPEDFEKFLQKRPGLKSAMAEVDKQCAKRRLLKKGPVKDQIKS